MWHCFAILSLSCTKLEISLLSLTPIRKFHDSRQETLRVFSRGPHRQIYLTFYGHTSRKDLFSSVTGVFIIFQFSRRHLVDNGRALSAVLAYCPQTLSSSSPTLSASNFKLFFKDLNVLNTYFSETTLAFLVE